jgi:secreted trypsin-like serine protease
MRKASSQRKSVVTKQQVRQMIRSANDKGLEEKYLDVAGAAGAISTATGFLSLSTIPQGNTAVSRVGLEVQPESLEVQYTWLGSADSTNLVRVVIFQWHADDAIDPPSASQLFEQGVLGANLNVVEPYSKPNADLHTILYDKTWSLVNGASSTSLQVITPWFKIKKRMRPMKFIGATTGTGMIYAAFVSDSGVVPHPTITHSHRLLFRDA